MTQDSNLSTKFPLWVPRPVEETLEIYADWAAHYDADLAEAGYDTPHRIAAALKPYVQPATAYWISAAEPACLASRSKMPDLQT